jgi:hypothetical protein
MPELITTRRVLSLFGSVALLVSFGVLIGTYTRDIKSTDYLQQAREAVPWLFWGLGSAVVGTALSSFGKGVRRTFGVSIGALLSIFWLLLGGSAV